MIMDKTTQYERMELRYIIILCNKRLKIFEIILIMPNFCYLLYTQSMNLESSFECYGISTQYQIT